MDHSCRVKGGSARIRKMRPGRGEDEISVQRLNLSLLRKREGTACGYRQEKVGKNKLDSNAQRVRQTRNNKKIHRHQNRRTESNHRLCSKKGWGG